jgi:hypothetical protein
VSVFQRREIVAFIEKGRGNERERERERRGR